MIVFGPKAGTFQSLDSFLCMESHIFTTQLLLNSRTMHRCLQGIWEFTQRLTTSRIIRDRGTGVGISYELILFHFVFNVPKVSWT
jgi:hypothetical protein